MQHKAFEVQNMGLILATSERIKEMECEIEAYKRGIENMSEENNRMQQYYRDMRDERDEIIKCFTDETERLNKTIRKLTKENVMLREIVAYYERERKK